MKKIIMVPVMLLLLTAGTCTSNVDIHKSVMAEKTEQISDWKQWIEGMPRRSGVDILCAITDGDKLFSICYRGKNKSFRRLGDGISWPEVMDYLATQGWRVKVLAYANPVRCTYVFQKE